jgi:hypothetical protein
MYTPDLVKSAASWAIRPPSGVIHAPNPFAQSRDWERVAPPTLKLTPRYADSFKKGMDLPRYHLISIRIQALRPLLVTVRQTTLVWENPESQEKRDSGA